MARKPIPDEETKAEADSFQTRPAAYNTASHYPYSDLTDRQFEILLYYLFGEDIRKGEMRKRYDQIFLMQGVGERGRDCTLTGDGRVKGLVQGKKYESRLGRPMVAREVIRFVLHYLLDTSLMSEPNKFTYYLAAASDFSEPAIKLFQNFAKVVEDPDLDSWIREELGGSKAFAGIKLEDVKGKLVDLLRVISVKPIGPADLDKLLRQYPDVLPMFFQVQMVYSKQGVVNDLRRVLEQFGITQIADEELRRLNERLSQVPPDFRLNLGVFNMFGYNLQILKNASGSPQFADMLKRGVEFKDSIDNVVLTTLNRDVSHAIESGVSRRRDISAVGKSIALGYVMQTLLHEYEERCLPGFLRETLRERAASWRRRDPLDFAKESARRTAECVLKNDFSSFRLKLAEEIAKSIYGHFSSVDDAIHQLDADLRVMLPLLDEIIAAFRNALPIHPTVIIGDLRFVEDTAYFGALIEKLRKFGLPST